MKRSNLKVFVVSGEEAKASLLGGNTNSKSLRALGFCREFEFNTPEEMKAFKTGFELWHYLEEPILWHSITTQTAEG